MKEEEALKYLKHAFETGRHAYSYLIEGPLRESAEPLVMKILMHILCSREEKGCGKCQDCKFVQNKAHPDVQWIEPEKKSRKIGTDRIRSVLSQMVLTSFCSSWKVCVIVGADRLGADSSNIMLKSLEEPLGKGLFFLLTDMPNVLLPTVVSRCQRVRLNYPETMVVDNIASHVIEIFKHQYGSKIEGTYGRAYRLIKILDEIKESIAFEETEKAKVEGGNLTKEELEARIQARYIEERVKILKYVLFWYRDVMMAKCGVSKDVWFYKEYEREIFMQSKKITLRQAFFNLKGIEMIANQLQYNMPQEMVLANMFAYMS